ncbi:hypothetical protein L3V82_01905 [Thiotrichales bacterium 19S3-7]|nr:hypothetical protein [Thiotrichales bacterium 19S3-7]MCF6800919.1 hypothetical protein [Thiotrichales bacterium 19S3-11]
MPLTTEQQAWFDAITIELGNIDNELKSNTSINGLDLIIPFSKQLTAGKLEYNDSLGELFSPQELFREADVRDLQTLYTRFKYQEGTSSEQQALKLLEMDKHLRGIGGDAGGAITGNLIASEAMLKIQTYASFPETCNALSISFPNETEITNAAKDFVNTWLEEKHDKSFADDLKYKVNSLNFDQLYEITSTLSKLGTYALGDKNQDNVTNVINQRVDNNAITIRHETKQLFDDFTKISNLNINLNTYNDLIPHSRSIIATELEQPISTCETEQKTRDQLDNIIKGANKNLLSKYLDKQNLETSKFGFRQHMHLAKEVILGEKKYTVDRTLHKILQPFLDENNKIKDDCLASPNFVDKLNKSISDVQKSKEPKEPIKLFPNAGVNEGTHATREPGGN